MEQVAGNGAHSCLSTVRCLGPAHVPNQGLFGWLGGRRVVIAWKWDPDLTNPPVIDQDPGSSAIPAEANSAGKKRPDF